MLHQMYPFPPDSKQLYFFVMPITLFHNTHWRWGNIFLILAMQERV